MKGSKFLAYLFMSGVVLIPFLFVSPAQALLVSPWRTELSIPPGTQQKGSLSIVNEKAAAVIYEIGFRDQSARSEPTSQWIELDTNPIRLEAHGRKTIDYVITVPEEAEGEYSGRLSFAEKEENQEQTGMMSISTQISVPIFVIVQGKERYSIEIINFRLKPHNLKQAEVQLRNSGNVHLRAKGECEVRLRGHDEVECFFKINEQGFPVYPGRDRVLIGHLPRLLESGTYVAKLRFPVPGGNPTENKAFVFEVKE